MSTDSFPIPPPLGSPPVEPPPTRPGFASNSLIIFGAQGGRTVLSALLEVCYARLLGPAGRGELTLALMVIAFASLVGGLGGQVPIILWTANERESPPSGLQMVYLYGLASSALVGILWIVTFHLWSPVFLRGITARMALIILPAIPLFVLLNYATSAFIGAERFTERAGILLGQQFVVIVAVLILVWGFSGQAVAALLATAIGVLVALIVSIVLSGEVHLLRSPMSFNKGALQKGLSLGLRGQLGNLVSFFNYRLDVFVLNYFRTTSAVGIYSLGVIISEGLWQLANAASTALLPRTARNPAEIGARFTCLVVRQVLVITTVGAVAMGGLAPFVIPRVFGGRFAGSVMALWLLLPGTVALAVGKVIAADLAGRFRPELSSLAAAVSMVATVVLDFMLIPRLGIRGAAIASSVAYAFATILGIFMLRSVAKIKGADLLPRWNDVVYYVALANRFKTMARQLFRNKAA